MYVHGGEKKSCRITQATEKNHDATICRSISFLFARITCELSSRLQSSSQPHYTCLRAKVTLTFYGFIFGGLVETSAINI